MKFCRDIKEGVMVSTKNTRDGHRERMLEAEMTSWRRNRVLRRKGRQRLCGVLRELHVGHEAAVQMGGRREV